MKKGKTKKDTMDKDGLKHLGQRIVELKSELESYSLPPKVLNKLNELELILKQETDKTLEGFGISAQVSLYPLHVTSLSPIINKALGIFDHLGLEVYPGAMSTIISGDYEMVWAALRNAFTTVAMQGEMVMAVTVSNACPLPSNFDTI